MTFLIFLLAVLGMFIYVMGVGFMISYTRRRYGHELPWLVVMWPLGLVYEAADWALQGRLMRSAAAVGRALKWLVDAPERWGTRLGARRATPPVKKLVDLPKATVVTRHGGAE